MNEILEKAKTDKALCIKFKNLAVEAKLYELGARLRDIELELFPESEEFKAAKKESEELNLLFKMVGMDVNERACWLINETLKVYRKRKGNFDLANAAKLKAKCHELFD